jgi:hypothetical protein
VRLHSATVHADMSRMWSAIAGPVLVYSHRSDNVGFVLVSSSWCAPGVRHIARVIAKDGVHHRWHKLLCNQRAVIVRLLHECLDQAQRHLLQECSKGLHDGKRTAACASANASQCCAFTGV